MILPGLRNIPQKPTPLLDFAAITATAAYSLRRLRGAWTGALIQVRRSSDGATQDIGFDLRGDLNVAPLLSFLGAASGTVNIWYDQSGNGRHVIQGTPSAQPRIVNAGALDTFNTGRPGLVFNGSSTFLSATYTTAQPFTRSSVLRFTSAASGGAPFGDGANNSLNFSASGSLSMYGGAANPVGRTGISAGDRATVVEVYNTTASLMRFNGSASGALSPGALSSLRGAVGASFNGTTASSFQSMVAGEFFLASGVIASGTLTAVEANQKDYWGTP